MDLGTTKREIAFLGDTVNATATIQEQCKHHGCDLVLSEQALRRVDAHTDELEVTKLGDVGLGGRNADVTLFGIRRKAGALTKTTIHPPP